MPIGKGQQKNTRIAIGAEPTNALNIPASSGSRLSPLVKKPKLNPCFYGVFYRSVRVNPRDLFVVSIGGSVSAGLAVQSAPLEKNIQIGRARHPKRANIAQQGGVVLDLLFDLIAGIAANQPIKGFFYRRECLASGNIFTPGIFSQGC